ncbi:DUF3109 family protein [Capnocytophaga catalasegens]|uniref:DUF3109 domain-containing protein n=1 Tax=Capnocytophaga catalasegens TaxID=1004260 RepID=A0AAV5AY50_9FLAO|nr:DUF3109 family protein [Capnocytophaga catalasegens]GIZ16411.1 hypothetical protein RCZ03_24110 [Capnocytophaga catalasegens]GJM50350.1 hypothetical protein RCZ15_13230 [Capnocytophaga catalasegens]GJM53867.1 hypothetical protein RCZ16_21830 [Capnocytophaga catalasegens]
MIQIDETIISEDILDYDFVCNLTACKGACCIEGDAGAPIDQEELPILETIYPVVKPYLTEKGAESIEKQGVYIKGEDGEWETPLIDGGECAYVIRNENQTALCAIEQAYNDGKIDWKKPISCHLYPIRLHTYSSFTAVNYDRWNICNDACVLGKKLQIPIYKFVKEALVRRFGKEWYAQLEEAKRLLDNPDL